MKSSRRGLFKLLPAAAIVAVTGGEAGAEKPVEERWVHYVNSDKRCLIARVLEEGEAGLFVEYEQRPATMGPGGPVHYFQRARTGPRREMGMGRSRPRPGTWHETEGCPCGRAYSEFAYGRVKKTDAEALAHHEEDQLLPARYAPLSEGADPCVVTLPTQGELERRRQA